MLPFADVSRSQTASNTMLYIIVRQMFTGTGIAIGAVTLRLADMIDKGTLPGFRLAFLMAAISFLYGYSRLAPDAGDQTAGAESANVLYAGGHAFLSFG